MSHDPKPAERSAKVSFWNRVSRLVRSLDEAFSRTEADDLMDRIGALERRVDALESGAALSEPRSAEHRP